MKVALLQNENADSVRKWEIACIKRGLDYDIINLTSSNWLEKIAEKPYDFFLLRPPGSIAHYKSLYDERIYVLAKVLQLRVYPAYEECYIYENKRLLSYFLKARNIPHPTTHVLYSKNEARYFAENANYPLVGKTAIGASGSGVKIIINKRDAYRYIQSAFSSKGIKRRFGPNRVTGSPKKWTTKAINDPSFFWRKLKSYLYSHKYGQKDFLILQEYVPHEFEWRAVKIGESYFAHKKIKTGDKASGSKGIEYVNPSPEILDFTRLLCEANNFNFMAIDFFEDGNGGFLVNELQTIFGHVQDHILEMDGNPGRFLYKDNQWVFERGNFNTNESYDLRLETAINLYKRGL